MGSQPGGVTAAPNESSITARLLSRERSEEFADKWLLELHIQAIESIQGPTFARVGQEVKGFTFESLQQIVAGTIITAQAEYLGDARGGQFQLTNVQVVNQEDR